MESTSLYRPFARFFPDHPANILDLGAGSGRDAAWMAGQGHRVVALEPAAKMRMAAMARHKWADINWLDGSLPDLAALNMYPDAFDLVLANAVWHHLSRTQSFRAFVRLKAVL
ncbi:MAG: methyltransferase domain-containing protein, partial [Pseudomonadota bacterium]